MAGTMIHASGLSTGQQTWPLSIVLHSFHSTSPDHTWSALGLCPLMAATTLCVTLVQYSAVEQHAWPHLSPLLIIGSETQVTMKSCQGCPRLCLRTLRSCTPNHLAAPG